MTVLSKTTTPNSPHTPNLRSDLCLIVKTLKSHCSPQEARKELSSLTYKTKSMLDILQKQQDRGYILLYSSSSQYSNWNAATSLNSWGFA